MKRKATLLCVKSKNSKQHGSKFKGPKRGVIRVEIRRNARLQGGRLALGP